MNKKDKKIITELKEYVNNGCANFSDGTLFYCCQLGLLEGNDIASAIDKIKEIIQTAINNNEILHNKNFDVNIFKNVTDKVKYIQFCDKRKITQYTYSVISKDCYLPVDFLITFQDKVQWKKIFKNALIKVEEKLNYLVDTVTNKSFWYMVSKDISLPEEFIEMYADRINWWAISECQQLSEQIIEKYADKVYWSDISFSQKLSEEFIEKYADKVKWRCIFEYQKISLDFFLKNIKYANEYSLYALENNQYIDRKEIEGKNIEMMLNMRDVV
ncbi:hypothetical protein [Anaerospora sp.]|uniref:hypothetical protein n=1 Tax=Anaerospora sp. TaxID=1960278 RepID=UPI00289C93C8|nr:hypothetical protein [Anaerospora sp.]